MSLQGNLRDFTATEILQLLGTQKKTGCLSLEWGAEKAVIYLQEGRIISSRDPNLGPNDPLLAFLRKVHRLSEEQCRGIASILRESNRDLEDVLLNGRYLDANDLGILEERQIIDSMIGLVRWENGTYRFDPSRRWPGVVVARLTVESAMIEAARRVDEHKRFMATFKDPYQVLSVHDLPDPNEDLSDEERELFGIIDGQRTVTEVVEAAPLTEYEAYEALDRMLRSRWIEVTGRRDPGLKPTAPVRRASAPAVRTRRWYHEVLVPAAVLLAFTILSASAERFHAALSAEPRRADALTQSRVDDVRLALELYRRERGVYPSGLERLVAERWLSADALHPAGFQLTYHLDPSGTYALGLTEAR